MGIFDRFPYSSTHEMNLDFMLGKATEIAESLQEVQDGLSDIDTHKAQAEQAAQAAQASQAAASASAGQAAQHKTDAEDAADRAETASTEAETAADRAETALGNMTDSETVCQEAAEEAQQYAQASQSHSNQAMLYKNDAETAKNNAAVSASQAAISAGSAANSATDSASSANSANVSATNATLQASNAATSAANATDAADRAEAVADEVTDLKSAITQKKTMAIPCSFSPITEKIDLSLSDYSGKKVFVSNRNLLPQFTAMTDHGITCTKNNDGSITLSGTADGTAVIAITVNEMPNLGPGTYALSCGNSQAMGDSNTFINVEIDGSYAAIYALFNSIDGKTTFTVPEGSRVTGIRIRISSGVTVPSNFKCYPQITEGTNFLEFIPHDGTVFIPTSGTIANVDAYTNYTYVCAQSGVSGTATFDAKSGKLAGKFAGKKIVCFGDSITGNFPAPTDYPSMIAEITGATVYNAGFGGCCMSDNNQARKDFTMCRLTDSIVAGSFSAQRNSGVSITYAGTSIDYVPERLTMLESIDWSEIDYITIAYGTNDWNSNYGLDNENNLLDTTTYIGAFRYSVEKLLAAYPNIKIMVITPLWRWWDTNTGMPSEIQADYIDSNTYAKGTGYKLWQYGDALAEAAKWYHIPVFDLYWNCMMTKQNRLEYFNYNDGTHPKLEGRELMAELISAHMESVY